MHICISHAGCNDGFCCAWLISRFWPDCTFIFENYDKNVTAEIVSGKILAATKGPTATEPYIMGSRDYLNGINCYDDKIKLSDIDLIITDFCYPRQILIELKLLVRSLVIIDHHDSRKPDTQAIDNAIFDTTKCGASLTFEYLKMMFQRTLACAETPHNKSDLLAIFDSTCEACNGTGYDPIHSATCRLCAGRTFVDKPNWLVSYIHDRDLFLHQQPYSHECTAAIGSYYHDFIVWDQIYLYGSKLDESGSYKTGEIYQDRDFEELSELKNFFAQGSAILRYRQRIINTHIKYAYWTTLITPSKNFKVIAVNCTCPKIWSDIAAQILKQIPECDNVVFYVDTITGERIHGIRSRANATIAAGDIATLFPGGGGHRQAAGFTTDSSVFTNSSPIVLQK